MTKLKNKTVQATVIDKYTNARNPAGITVTEYVLVLRSDSHPPLLRVSQNSKEFLLLSPGDKTDLLLYLLPNGKWHPSKSYAEMTWKQTID